MTSKEFLTIDTNNNNNNNDNTIITFNRKYSGIASRFSLWKIPHQQIQKNNDYITIGVQSCLSNKWITKSKWNSNIYCASATFNSREEFEVKLHIIFYFTLTLWFTTLLFRFIYHQQQQKNM